MDEPDATSPDSATGEEELINDDALAEGTETTVSAAQVQALARLLNRSDDNHAVIGELTLHYPTRDVRMVLDGDAALRLLASASGRVDPALQDPITSDSSARNGWAMVTKDSLLAVTWLPDTSSGHPDTIVIDPA
jgi:hypothetical protein